MSTPSAITFTAPEEAELRSVAPDTAPLGPQELTGRTLATVVSAGTELAAYRGVANWVNFPFVPGYAAVFQVEAVGSSVTGVQVGDRVFHSGPHRSHQRTRAEAVSLVPPNLPAEKAVFARLMGVSMSTLVTTTARPPANVLVTGLGPVGHLAAKIFAACGYEVTACDPVESRRAALAGVRSIRTLAAVPANEPQFDLVVECSGHEQAALDGCNAARKRGEVVLVGVPWQKRSDRTAFDLLHAVFHRYAVLRSGWEWEVPGTATDFRPGSLRSNYAAAIQWLAEGRISIDGLYALAAPREAQQVYQDLTHNRAAALATVFDWSR
jgi:threonine dehydrogenase-like Zn-dependent dehydrogenase